MKPKFIEDFLTMRPSERMAVVERLRSLLIAFPVVVVLILLTRFFLFDAADITSEDLQQRNAKGREIIAYVDSLLQTFSPQKLSAEAAHLRRRDSLLTTARAKATQVAVLISRLEALAERRVLHIAPPVVDYKYAESGTLATVSFGLRGDLGAFMTFLSEIPTLNPGLAVRDLTVSADDEGTPLRGKMKLAIAVDP